MQVEREMRVRRGDPLIQIDAQEDAAQVVALMPDGEVKRFHVPSENRKVGDPLRHSHLSVGRHVHRHYSHRPQGRHAPVAHRALHIDGTPPEGKGRVAAVTGSQPMLRLEMDASPDTARVTALLPWGDPVSLQPSTQTANRFFALVPLPSEFEGKVATVTFVLTDKAHNRTTVTVNMEDDRE